MMSFGEVFTFVQSIIGFLVISDIFYERIIQNKVMSKVNNNMGIEQPDLTQLKRSSCDKCSGLNRMTRIDSRKTVGATWCALVSASPDSALGEQAPTAPLNERRGR